MRTLNINTKLYRVELYDDNSTLEDNKTTCWFWTNKEIAKAYLIIYKHEYMNIPLENLRLVEYIIINKINCIELNETNTTMDFSLLLNYKYNTPIYISDGFIDNQLRAKWLSDNGFELNFIESYGSHEYYGLWFTYDIEKLKTFHEVSIFNSSKFVMRINSLIIEKI